MENTILAPISIGELVDKITILEIKQTKTQDFNKVKNILFELHQLEDIFVKLAITGEIAALKKQLKGINLELWDIEDSKRMHEKEQLFDDDFIQLARKVYLKNDQRAAIKKQINILTNSGIIEEKLYWDV